MGKRFDRLAEVHIDFIRNQKVFFVATAGRDGQVNVSPKGHDTLRITGPNEIVWMNLTGSGNETAAHLVDTNRMTLMWCAFEGAPRILRAYGTAETIHPRDEAWQVCAGLIPSEVGTRQYFRMAVSTVQTSCGFAVPLYSYEGERDTLRTWTERKGDEGVRDYWEEKNATSLDGLPTGILE